MSITLSFGYRAFFSFLLLLLKTAILPLKPMYKYIFLFLKHTMPCVVKQ